MKKIILLVLLSTMLLLVGCGEGEQQVSTGVFVGGTQGIIVQFYPLQHQMARIGLWFLEFLLVALKES